MIIQGCGHNHCHLECVNSFCAWFMVQMYHPVMRCSSFLPTLTRPTQRLERWPATGKISSMPASRLLRNLKLTKGNISFFLFFLQPMNYFVYHSMKVINLMHTCSSYLLYCTCSSLSGWMKRTAGKLGSSEPVRGVPEGVKEQLEQLKVWHMY